MSRRSPTSTTFAGQDIFTEFYDPDGQRYGLPTYPYHWAPEGLLTIRQLRAKGLRPGGQDIVAQILLATPQTTPRRLPLPRGPAANPNGTPPRRN